MGVVQIREIAAGLWTVFINGAAVVRPQKGTRCRGEVFHVILRHLHILFVKLRNAHSKPDGKPLNILVVDFDLQ